MAYQIKCGDHVLHDPRDEAYIVYNPKCNLEVNTVGEASFSIFANHPNYGVLEKMRSVFEILQDGEPIFRGRMTEDTRDFDNTKAVDLEGVLAFFNDSIVRPFSFPEDFLENEEYITAANSGNVVEFFLKWLVDRHNEQTQPFQRFRLGNVTVSDKNNYLSRSNAEYASTWETLKSKLFDSALGGYLCIRYEADGNYIDYLKDFESVNAQRIEYGENLLDLSSESDASATYSAIIPLGKKKNEIDPESSDESRLTLVGLPDRNVTDDIVKSGDVLYSKSAVERFGFICAPVSETTWDDVTLADNLESNGVEYMTQTATMLANTITIKALDLHFSDNEIEAFRIYKYVNLVSAPHDQEDSLKLTKLEIDIENPQNTVITLGEMRLSLTDINASTQQNASERVDSLNTHFNTQITEIIQKAEEVVTSKAEQLADSITLEVTGSLGSVAEISLSVGDKKMLTQLELTKIRESFANDNSSVTISGGLITFNSGTIVINSNNFSLDSAGRITANGATINGKVTTVSSSFMTELDKGSLRLYYDDVLCGTINTKYWSGAATEGISLRVEEGGNYIMFSHADDTQGSGYVVDYYLNAGWSSNYDEMHIFQTSARFLDDAYFAGYTRIRSLRLFGSDGEYLVGINSAGNGLSVSKLKTET